VQRALRAFIFSYSAAMAMVEPSGLFARLADKDLEAVRRITSERVYATGREIFKEGDAGDGLYLVKAGRVEISSRIEGQEGQHVFSQIGPGEVFGEMAVIEDKPRSASAVASQPTTTLFLPRAEVLALMEASPALGMLLLREISNRLREFNRRYLNDVLQGERLAVVGRFARSIIHDLKNPLNSIGLSADWAGLPNATLEQRQKAMATIRSQVDSINDMVGEILDFTQGTPSQVLLGPLVYDQFVRQVVEELAPEASLKATTIELENAPPAVALVFNPKRLRRVFQNLVRNAFEAMPHGGRLRLRFSLAPDAVITELQDSGPGLAPEIVDRLFEPFATHGKAHGTGLGLCICRRIIYDHHGWITARSHPGDGAIFTFGLPRLPQ
jgi:signal transduction histidine kinase